MYRTIARRSAAGVLALGLLASLGACDSLLEVENFGAIDEEDVQNPVFVPEMVNATINAFQEELTFLIYAGAILTDEALNGHNFEQWQDFDLRIVEPDNSQLASNYEALQSARGTGDDMNERLREALDDPGSSIELATSLAYTGYSYVYLGEYFCYSPIEANGPAVDSDGIMAAAVDRFEEAIQIANSAGGSEGEHIANLARVGAARASLNAGNMTDAVAFASQVPPDFEVWIRHTESPTSLRNYMVGATSGTNRSLGVDFPFVGLNDRRVRHTAEASTGHNQKTLLYTPFQSPSYDAWSPIGEDQEFEYDTAVRLASGLEARYILAEAGGMSDAELLDFIDERRTVGGQDVFPGADLQAGLRDQRRRDFFLDGHRLGDLRRYIKLYGIDEFPSGPHPNDEEWGWGNYGTATCFVPHQDESTSNPNYTPLS